MKRNLTLWAVAFALFVIGSCTKVDISPNKSGSGDASAARGGGSVTVTTYVGQATGLNATITQIINGTVVSNQTILSQTGFLPATGGSLTASHSLANVQNFVTAETLSASTTGQAGSTVSQSTATNFNITMNGHVITASGVSATATTTCGTVSGSTQIQNLVIDGRAIVVTGAPNQSVFLPGGGFIMINAQSAGKGKAKTLTVTGLHIILPNAADVKVATVRAEIKC